MHSEVSESWYIAAGVAITMLILSLGLTLFLAGEHFGDQVSSNVEAQVIATVDDDAFYLASHGDPVPVAAIWKVVGRIGIDNVTACKLYSPTFTLISTDVNVLKLYCSKQAYFSWYIVSDADHAANPALGTGQYVLEVTLVT